MDQSQDPKNKKKKNRFVPFFWIFGLGMAGGVLLLALMLGKKNNQLKGLETELTNTSQLLGKEKSNWQNELQRLNTTNTELLNKNNALDQKLKDQSNRYQNLASKNKQQIEQEKQRQNNYNSLLGTVNALKGENDLLKGNLADEQAAANDLRRKLTEFEDLLNTQKNQASEQTEKYKNDSVQTVEVIDSFMNEIRLKFCNITELNGGYGVYRRNIPYAHYFGGISNVSGFKISKHFTSGLGVGLFAYNEGITMPLYLDFRYQFNKRKYTPYFWFDSGLNMKFEDMSEPMLFVNPGVGLYKSISDNFALNLGAGVFIQRDILTKSTFVNLKLGLIYIKSLKKRRIIH
jgi:hypothetical protein